MTRPTPNRSPDPEKEGNVLIMVLVVLLIITAISTVSLRNAMAMAKLSNRQVLMEQTHFIAESGLEKAASVINSSVYIGTATTGQLDLGGGRAASYTITPLNTQGSEFSVHAAATWRDVTRELRIDRVFRPTFLEYGMFFDRWEWNGTPLSWLPGDVVEGKVWSGTPQGIAGFWSGGQRIGPIFRDINETAAQAFARDPEFASFLPPHIPWADHTHDDLRFWEEHPEHHAVNVERPALMNIDFDRVRNIAGHNEVEPELINPDLVPPDLMPGNRALVLRGRTEIRFRVEEINGRETGVMDVRNHDRFGDFSWHPLYAEALDLVIVEDHPGGGPNGHENGTLLIGDSGNQAVNVVKGNMTIWTDRDVNIQSSIIYNNLDLESSEDKIGVISKQSIYVDRTNRTDLYLYGGYIAAGLDGSGYIGLNQFNSGGVRGHLYFVGSQVGRRRHPWGEFALHQGEIRLRHGYHRSMAFDPRFAVNPPPFTPTIGGELRYEGWH